MVDQPVMDAQTRASATLAEIRVGSYYDSVVLMQLQRALAALPAVLEAGVVMGVPANKTLLAHSGLLTDDVEQAAPEDLILIVRAESAHAAQAALAKVDDLLAARPSQPGGAYRPKTLAAATRMAPQAEWVLISLPGRFAATAARDALNLGKNVFLYSDNVSLEDEIALKKSAAAKNLLLLGPDCGAARVDGVGLGFANRVRRGRIGIVAASGTGLQTAMAGIHRLGGGVSQAYGVGGRDLSEEVQAKTARQCLARLADDPGTDGIVIISKPPAAAVAQELLAAATACDKPVVVYFIGYEEKERRPGVRFARTLDESAELAVLTDRPVRQSAGNALPDGLTPPPQPQHTKSGSLSAAAARPHTCLRALYSGGTLAYEALHLLRDRLPSVRSNAPLPGGLHLKNAHRSHGHTVVDLGGDDYTVGRLHPMLDNELRIRRLLQEAQDPETGLILLDVVLGDGAHPDPASELAPAIGEAIALAARDGRRLPVIAAVIGTDADPQGLDRQIEQLAEAGASVFIRHDDAVRFVADSLAARVDDQSLSTPQHAPAAQPPRLTSPSPQEAAALARQTEERPSSSPFTAINVGLESFTDSVRAQGAEVVHVDWRPPAGGDERLAALLARLRP